MKITVPATSANLGPGFDTLGLAVNLYNHYHVRPGGWSEDNLILTAYRRFYEYFGLEPIPVSIEVEAFIPESRGLGSSASCIVGGLMAANEVSGKALDKETLFRLAALIEGHPDNVAPALFGGIILSVKNERGLIHRPIQSGAHLEFLAFIPSFKLSTRQAREVLPKEVSMEDALFNLSRVALLIHALSKGEPSLLKEALKDRLHQPYRQKLIPEYEVIQEILQERAWGMYLSGAGPTLMALTKNARELMQQIQPLIDPLEGGWQMKALSLCTEGARVVKSNFFRPLSR